MDGKGDTSAEGEFIERKCEGMWRSGKGKRGGKRLRIAEERKG